MNPLSLYDIGHPDFLQPIRCFTPIFLERSLNLVLKGVHPTAAVETAQQDAFNQTNQTMEFPDLRFEDTEALSEDGIEEFADDENEAEIAQDRAQYRGNDANVPESLEGGFHKWYDALTDKGFSNLDDPVDEDATGTSEEENSSDDTDVDWINTIGNQVTGSLHQDVSHASIPSIAEEDDVEEDLTFHSTLDIPHVTPRSFEAVEDMEVDEEFHSALDTFHTSTPRKANDAGPSSTVCQPQPTSLDVSGLAEALDEIDSQSSTAPWEVSSILEAVQSKASDQDHSDGQSKKFTTSTPKSGGRHQKKRTAKCMDSSPQDSTDSEYDPAENRKSKGSKRSQKKVGKVSRQKKRPPPLKKPRQSQSKSRGQRGSQAPQVPPPASDSEEPTENVIEVSLARIRTSLPGDIIFQKFTNPKKKWCWFTSSMTLVVRGFHLSFLRKGELMNSQRRPRIIVMEFDSVIDELAKLKGGVFLIDTKNIIHAFCRKHRIKVTQDSYDYPAIIKEFQTPEGEFFYKLGMTKENGEYLSKLVPFLQPEVNVKSERTACLCFGATESCERTRKSYIGLTLPTLNPRTRKAETFSELLEKVTLPIEEDIICTNAACATPYTKKTTTTFKEASEFLVLSFDRSVVLPPLPGSDLPRVQRNDQGIDLVENDTLLLPMADGTQVRYTLVGMLCHIGSVDSGHIVAHVKYNDRPNEFLLVNDLSKSIDWSHLAGPEYSPNQAFLFYFMKASTADNPMDVVNIGSQSQQQQDVQDDDDEEEEEEEEPPAAKVDQVSQGPKLLVRNQKNPSPLYRDLHYLFADPKEGLGWFATVLNAIVHTCRVSNFRVPHPPKKKHRKRWTFEHFFRELYHLQQGMLYSPSQRKMNERL